MHQPIPKIIVTCKFPRVNGKWKTKKKNNTWTCELSPLTTIIPKGLFSVFNSIVVSLLQAIVAVAGSWGTSGAGGGSGLTVSGAAWFGNKYC